MTEIREVPRGTVYTHTLRGQPITVIRGHVPVEKLTEQVVGEEKNALKQSSEEIRRLLTEGGAVTSTGKIIAIGLDKTPITDDAKKKVSEKGIINIFETHAIRDFGLQVEELPRGSEKVFFLKDGFVSDLTMVHFRADSVALRHPPTNSPTTFYLQDLSYAFGKLVEEAYKTRGVDSHSFSFRSIARQAMNDAYLAAQARQTPSIQAPTTP